MRGSAVLRNINYVVPFLSYLHLFEKSFLEHNSTSVEDINFRLNTVIQLIEGKDTTVRVLDNGTILHFDDSTVIKEDIGYLNTREVQESCYILFYERIEVSNPYTGTGLFNEENQDKFIDSLDLLPGKYIIARHSNISLTVADICTLKDGEWLNDQVINCYFRLLQRSCPFLVCVDTFFIEALIKDRDATKFLTKQHFAKSTEKILIPSLYNSHWSLLVLNLEDATINIVDSMDGHRRDALFTANLVQNYLNDGQLGNGNWKSPQVRNDVYKQSNTDDCGVFLCQNAVAEVVSKFHCTQGRIHDIRTAMILEIATETLMPRTTE